MAGHSRNHLVGRIVAPWPTFHSIHSPVKSTYTQPRHRGEIVDVHKHWVCDLSSMPFLCRSRGPPIPGLWQEEDCDVQACIASGPHESRMPDMPAEHEAGASNPKHLFGQACQRKLASVAMLCEGAGLFQLCHGERDRERVLAVLTILG